MLFALMQEQSAMSTPQIVYSGVISPSNAAANMVPTGAAISSMPPPAVVAQPAYQPAQPQTYTHGGSGVRLIMTNMTIATHLGQKLDMKVLTKVKPKLVEFDTKRNAAIMRLRQPSANVVLFPSGKAIVSGCSNFQDAKLTVGRVAAVLVKQGMENASARDLTQRCVQNLVAVAHMMFHLDLEGLNYAYPDQTKYEPELFPGLAFTMDSGVMLMVFVNGKVVFTGVKNFDTMKRALDTIYPVLSRFRKHPGQPMP